MISIVEAAKDWSRKTKVGFDMVERARTVGASEIGLCARRVAYRKNGVVPDKEDDESGFAIRGNLYEDGFTAPMLAHWADKLGARLLFAGQANQIRLENKYQSATPDGLFIDMPKKSMEPYGIPLLKNGQLVGEFKSIDPRVGAHKLPKNEHVLQTLQQLGLIRKGTEYKPEWGAVIYVNASDALDIKVHPVKWDQLKFDGLTQRAKKILTAPSPETLSPEGKIDGGCAMCEYSVTCQGYASWLQDDEKQPKGSKLKLIEELAERITKLDAEVSAKSEAKRTAEDAMYAALAQAKTRFVKSKRVVVVAKKTASQNRYDSAKLKARIEELGGSHDDCKSQTKEGTALTVELV